MMSFDTRKSNDPEINELNDEELDQVAGGSADETSSKGLPPLFSPAQLERNKQE